MDVNCGLMQDLLPLYIDGGRTEDTIRLVETHLRECEGCRELYEQMHCPVSSEQQEQTAETVILQKYGQMVRKEKRLRILLTVFLILIGTILGTLTALTLNMMHHQKNPTVYPAEAGIWDLTANDLIVDADKSEEYTLFTNYTQIKVELLSETAANGTVWLYNADYSDPILSFALDEETQEGCFTGLSAQYLYVVKVECDMPASVTISEGRRTDFFYCLALVLDDLTCLFS